MRNRWLVLVALALAPAACSQKRGACCALGEHTAHASERAPVPNPIAAPSIPAAPAAPVAIAQTKQPPAKQPPRPPTPPGCGGQGQPDCPLQAWMKENNQEPLQDNDLARVAASLDQLPRFVPDPAWNQGATGWATVARNGATAARAGDVRGTRAACKACHTAWQDRYRERFRARPIR